MKGLTTHKELERAQLLERIEELERENSKLQSLADNMSDLFEHHSSIMYLLDPYTLQILDCNQAAESFYGYKKCELIQKKLSDLNSLGEKDMQEEIELSRLEKRDYFSLKHKLHNGEVKDVEVRSTPIFLRNGEERFFAIINDVTRQKEAAQKLAQAKEVICESDRLKSEFLNNMSHEIRTPLNGILGFSEMLSEKDISDEEKSQYLNIIENCGNHLLLLVNNLIDSSQLEAGQLKLKERNTNLVNLFEELKTTFLSKMNDRNRHLDLFFSIRNENELSNVNIDSIRLKQILTNLIDNALKFTDSGFVKFGASLKENVIEFFVEDTGLGLSPLEQEEVFKRFIQVDTSNARKFQGSGLGLTIVKGLVELMGGKMWLYSEKSVGSTFCFSLPYKPSYLLSNDPPIGLDIDFDWSRKNILIAESDDTQFHFLEFALKRTGIKIDRAITGVEIIKKYRDNKIDLVLADVNMPVFSGLEAIAELRDYNKDLPVVMQISAILESAKEDCIRAGATTVIRKPIDIQELYSTLRENL